MLVLNPMTLDTRVEKEATSLAAEGHDVTVVATALRGLPASERRSGYTILRLPYRRAVKDRVTGVVAGLRTEAAQRRHALRAAAGQRPVGAGSGPLLRWHGLVAESYRGRAKLVWLLGGSYLKGVRSAVLPYEYWSGLVSRLPQRLPRCDVVHAHDLGTLAAAVRLTRNWQASFPGLPRPRVVYDSHELFVEQNPRWKRREKALWRIHERRWIQRADLVLTVSEGIADVLRARYRLTVRPTVLYNTPVRTAARTGPDLRADLGLPTSAPLVAYVGAVKPGRGVDVLVDALRLDPSWHLALVGADEAPEARRLADTVAGTPADDHLHLVKAVEAADLPTYLRTADIGVHPLQPTCLNHALAMPNKLFDYVFAGLPVAVSDLPEMRRFTLDNGIGVVFDGRDPRAVAATLTCALAHPERIRPTPERLAQLTGQYLWPSQERVLLDRYAHLLLTSRRDPTQ